MAVIDDIATILRNNGFGTGFDDAFCGLAHCGNTFCAYIGDGEVPTYIFRRNVPPITDSLVAVLDGGGGTSDLGLVATDQTLITIVSQSVDMATSRENIQHAKNSIIQDTPYTNIDGKVIYKAEVLSDYSFERKKNNVPIYVHVVTFVVSHQSGAYDPIAESVDGSTFTDVIANYIESITGQPCYRGQMPPIDGLVYSVRQTGGGEDDERNNSPVKMDNPSFEIRIRSEDVLEAESKAKELHDRIHQARHIGPIIDILASNPRYERYGKAGPMHNQYIAIETTMERI